MIPADEPLLDPYLRDDVDVVPFGTDVDPGGLRSAISVTVLARELRVALEVPFTARHSS